MRLIDADELRANLYREVFGTPSLQRLDNSCYIPYRMFEDALRKTPNVDAVPVVRCKDCKKYRPIFKQALPLLGTCELCGLMRETDYCSMGEGREE